MPTIATLIAFMSAGLILNLTPGPDMLYVASRSASEGRAAGLVSALGITAGCLLHLAAMALGLAALLDRWPAAYDVVRIAGASYLIWLGIQALRRPALLVGAAVPRPAPLVSVFTQGVVTNLLNPKVVLFFLAFIPQFVDAERGNTVAQVVVLGLTFNVTGTIVNCGVALLASRATTWLRTNNRSSRRLNQIMGLTFFGLGLRLLWTERAR